MRQQSLIKEPKKETKRWWVEKQHSYGGALDYRKTKRPFDSKKLIHSVLKSRGEIQFTKSEKSIRELMQLCARKCGVKIKDAAIEKITSTFYFPLKSVKTSFHSYECFLPRWDASLYGLFWIILS